jgi:hypothetical protein
MRAVTPAIIERGVLMFKKLFFAAAVAAAVAVPLAGVASADAGDPNGNGVGKGGMPQRLGDFAATGVTPALAPTNDPIPPGQEFNTAKDYYAAVHPGQKANTPTAVGEFESFVWTGRTLADGTPVSNDPNDWTNITPGLAVKPLGPGCGKGRTGLPADAPTCVPK